MNLPTFLRSRRARLTAGHLVASAVLAVAAAAVVFAVWYPPPFAALAGGLALFAILIAVDVVVGPALTALVATDRKSASELRRDLAVIVLLQLGALGYGLYSIAMARPVYLAFEVDRLRVVSAADVEPTLLAEAPPALQRLPWAGPATIAAVKPSDASGLLRTIDLGLAGVDLAFLPSQWRTFEPHRASAWAAARPVGELVARHPESAQVVERSARALGADPAGLRFMPIVSRHANAVALIAGPRFEIVGTLPYDGFF